jgi:hypothetical protein
LLRFQLEPGNVQSRGVKRAVFMGNQDDAPEVMNVDQESQLLDDPFLFAIGKEVAGEARRAAGHRKPIVAWQLKRVFQEVVELLSETPVAAIDRRRMDATRIEANTALENGLATIHIHHTSIEGRSRQFNATTRGGLEGWKGSGDSAVGG